MEIGILKPYAKNAKKHNKKQIQKVAESIKNFGFVQPIVIDKNNEVVIGHARLEAAKLLKLKEVPTISVENLTDEQVKALRLADNKLNESEWDMGLAIEELKGLSPEMFDLTGFDADLLIEPDEKDDVIPENPPTIAKLGDIWQLGRHRLMCGDSTKKEDVERLMDGKKADMVFTDPPYNVDYSGRGENTSEGILNDKMSKESFDIFLVEIFKRYNENCKVGGGWYVFHSSSTQHQFQKAIEASGWNVKNQIIWNKPTASMGWGDYRWKHEPMFYCGKENTVFYGDRTHSTIIDFHKSEQQLLNWVKRVKRDEQNGKTTIWTMKRDSVSGYKHPTQKPVELISYAIFNSSKADDIVLDLFLGSGSTLIACEKTNRICYGMELDEKYCDVIIKRYEDYTQTKAIKL